MSRCHFCGAERSADGAPCPSCGERPGAPPVGRWWESNATVIVALAVLGPFALPLVWRHSRYKVWTKVTLTIITVGFSVWAVLFTKSLYERLLAVLSGVS